MSIVVRCATKAHRVRLDGSRFWASARCPRCNTVVDPTRLRRVGAWLRDRYRTSAPTRVGRLVWAGAWAYLLFALAVWAMVWWVGDRWWLATVFLFGPRWLVLVPLAFFVPLAALRRTQVLPVLMTAIILLGPVMGFRVGWTSWFGRSDRPGDLRIVTFNAAGWRTVEPGHLDALLSLRPDVIALQECWPEIPEPLRATNWFQHDSGGTLCLLSRFPIEEVAQQERESVESAGGSGWVIRYVIRTPATRLTLTNLHLDTPRAGFEQVRAGRLTEGMRDLDSKSVLREIESRRARRWVDEGGGAFIVAGDFNLPVESVIYQRYWGGLTNAFSRAGFGFGATRLNGWIRVRIDHVLVAKGWKVLRSFVGPDLGSDHRPLITDVRWIPSDRDEG